MRRSGGGGEARPFLLRLRPIQDGQADMLRHDYLVNEDEEEETDVMEEILRRSSLQPPDVVSPVSSSPSRKEPRSPPKLAVQFAEPLPSAVTILSPLAMLPFYPLPAPRHSWLQR